MGQGYDYEGARSVHRLSCDALPLFEPDFHTVILERGAKLTDLISSAPLSTPGFVVSSKLREVLEAHRLPQRKYFPLPMLHHGKPVSGYFWLHLPHTPVPLTEDTSPSDAEAIIQSDEDLRVLDLLRLYRPARFAYCFVSGPLCAAMEAAKISGVRLGSSKIFR